MTEAQFRGWIRSALRRLSQRWKPLYQTYNKAKRAIEDTERSLWGNRVRWVYQCEVCENWFPKKLVQVDHKVPCGSLSNIETDAGPFILRLLCEADGLRLLCLECHHLLTKEGKHA